MRTVRDSAAEAKYQRKLAYRREYGRKHKQKLSQYSMENRKKNWPIWRVRYCIRRRYNYLFHWERVHKVERKHMLKKKYRMLPEDYERMLASQGGVCAICMTAEKGRHARGYLCIDHEHGTKPAKIRGLLCHDCNLALGGVRDSIDTLRNMIAYLEQHAKPQ